MVRLLCSITASALVVQSALAVDISALEKELQSIIDRATLLSRGTAFSLGVALPGKTISLSSGRQEMNSQTASSVLPTDPFAMGSTAKMYTAAAVLRLVDSGSFALDDKAVLLFDKLWTRLNGTSIVNILGPQMNDVTVRHLLQMRSGIPDFDNMASRSYQFDHPGEDLGPITEISFLKPHESFVCAPATCGAYSSSNYEFLGLILAQQAGADSWDKYTQADGLPKNVLAHMPITSFATHGPCSNYTNVHAYSSERQPPVDVYSVSCTNGWTCGNLISNAADAAFFVRALLGKDQEVLSAATQKEMKATLPLTTGWSTGLQYGLGLMDFSHNVKQDAGTFLGHGGDTYGFNAQTAYDSIHDFGMSVVANTENISLVDRVIPEVHQAVARALGSRAAVIV
jgi:D-alanyl-D-alanine carboxypeptidase